MRATVKHAHPARHGRCLRHTASDHGCSGDSFLDHLYSCCESIVSYLSVSYLTSQRAAQQRCIGPCGRAAHPPAAYCVRRELNGGCENLCVGVKFIILCDGSGGHRARGGAPAQRDVVRRRLHEHRLLSARYPHETLSALVLFSTPSESRASCVKTPGRSRHLRRARRRRTSMSRHIANLVSRRRSLDQQPADDDVDWSLPMGVGAAPAAASAPAPPRVRGRGTGIAVQPTNSVRSATADEGIRLLKQGVAVTKYGRNGQPHKEKLLLSADERSLGWAGHVASKLMIPKALVSSARTVPLDDIVELWVGHETDIFKRHVRQASGKPNP